MQLKALQSYILVISKLYFAVVIFFDIMQHIYFTELLTQQRAMTERRLNLHFTPQC